MKKLGILGAVVVVLFAAIIILTNLANQDKLKDNPYDTDSLDQATIDLLDNENYQNIILPEELEEKIDSGEPVVAYMFSPTCIHCQAMTPALMPIADEVDVHIDQYNLLEYDQGWNQYNIESTPTLIYFKDGKEVNRIIGDYSKNPDVIYDFLEQTKS
ncbi:thioredoxin family protein [Ureibacillus chungkukjangi]|uniref:Thiol-disulfide isomerase/thioredoxin n=1 Tax=Ureibacillus chungkukjangi TaxID=1202712 RepID=A0A318TH78_9BACL|nr:thioredoxin family protein [Ureibacillus chungkukjangi]MCM3389452.1 thioredoxin family protein [Ureibacillus chungkukjangi]PYF04232.1 thiol-disulfide isomerase/thioredoxin [Ureibacillus chungkukjangi]